MKFEKRRPWRAEAPCSEAMVLLSSAVSSSDLMVPSSSVPSGDLDGEVVHCHHRVAMCTCVSFVRSTCHAELVSCNSTRRFKETQRMLSVECPSCILGKGNSVPRPNTHRGISRLLLTMRYSGCAHRRCRSLLRYSPPDPDIQMFEASTTVSLVQGSFPPRDRSSVSLF
jgi:hypothetical protein